MTVGQLEVQGPVTLLIFDLQALSPTSYKYKESNRTLDFKLTDGHVSI